MEIELDPVERRILGALLEKQRSVPDTYPLSLNALRAACNQSTSRDPVTSYDEAEILEGLKRLRDRELVRYIKVTGSRVVKYHQRLEEQLSLDAAQAALVAVLLLRGPQTAGELATRTERLHSFGSRADVEAALTGLAGREEPLVMQLERQAGQRDHRWSHLFDGRSSITEAAAPPVDREAVLVDGARARDTKVTALYDQIAAAYDIEREKHLCHEPLDLWLLDRLGQRAGGGQGLEVGCGTGTVAARLQAQGVTMTGLDVSAGMLTVARENHPELTLVQGSFDVPPMPRGADPRNPGWDLVVAFYSFVHLAQSELAGAVAALAKVVRRGGTVLLALSVGDEIYQPGEVAGVTTDVGFVRHDTAAVRAAVRQAGLVETERYLRGPYPHESGTDRLYLVAMKPASTEQSSAIPRR